MRRTDLFILRSSLFWEGIKKEQRKVADRQWKRNFRFFFCFFFPSVHSCCCWCRVHHVLGAQDNRQRTTKKPRGAINNTWHESSPSFSTRSQWLSIAFVLSVTSESVESEYKWLCVLTCTCILIKNHRATHPSFNSVHEYSTSSLLVYEY